MPARPKGARIVQPGHLERFNPAVLAIEPQLRRPMFFEAHRLCVFTPRALDVDVVLDLMIHDLDIVLTFARSPVREVRAVGLPILSPKVDIANVRVEFESGCVANFTASRVSTERCASCASLSRASMSPSTTRAAICWSSASTRKHSAGDGRGRLPRASWMRLRWPSWPQPRALPEAPRRVSALESRRRAGRTAAA